MARTAVCTVCEDHRESTFRVEGLCCQQEVEVLQRRLGGLRGVERLSADVVRQQMRVAYDAAVTSTGAIAEAVAETGMRAWIDREGPTDAPRTSFVSQAQWLAVATAAILAAIVSRLAGAPEPWTIALLITAVATGGVTTFRRAWFALRGRVLDMYVLMTVAVIGAAVIGEWFEAATVVVLFALAQALERRSLDRARQAIHTLVAAVPSTVRLVDRRGERTVPLAAVRVGDTLRVAPGERIPLDGTVADGDSDVNQAPVTGESLPVPRSAGDRVFAGSINGHGALDVRVTAVGEDTTIARIIHLVERAQAQRAPSQAWIDRFARRYTPAVIGLAALVAFVPPVFLGQSILEWGYRALVLLVIACPCALVLSTPVSIVSALAAAARRGVLVKGGIYLERLAAIRAVALDKTGTLTHGVLGVVEVRSLGGQTVSQVLSAAAAAAGRSSHPVDRAIAAHARRERVEAPVATSMRSLPGLGVEAQVGDDVVLLGSGRLFERRGLLTDEVRSGVEALEGAGMVVVLVARGGRALGLVGLTDELRVHGREAVAALRAAGVEHVAMLTGDHHRSAQAAGAAGTLDRVESGLLPQDKVAVVENLRARYGAVAMVGDGINDAPALAAADVGIAMGAAGTHAAIETADVALMSDDLRAVSYAIRLGRSTLATIRANVAAAFVIKLAFVLLAVAGLATLWMAVAADVGASLLVVANALRLLRTA